MFVRLQSLLATVRVATPWSTNWIPSRWWVGSLTIVGIGGIGWLGYSQWSHPPLPSRVPAISQSRSANSYSIANAVYESQGQNSGQPSQPQEDWDGPKLEWLRNPFTTPTKPRPTLAVARRLPPPPVQQPTLDESMSSNVLTSPAESATETGNFPAVEEVPSQSEITSETEFKPQLDLDHQFAAEEAIETPPPQAKIRGLALDEPQPQEVAQATDGSPTQEVRFDLVEDERIATEPLTPWKARIENVRAATTSRSPSAPVEEKARQYVKKAAELSQHGALMASQAEYKQAIRYLAQAHDLTSSTTAYSESVALGFQALREAEDFLALRQQLEADLDLDHILSGHRLQLINKNEPMTAAAAQQIYMTFAQERLSAAVGSSAAGSDALLGMGKVHMHLAKKSAEADRLHSPKAIVLFQAALNANSSNFIAANELGVLLASSGQLEAACEALQHSAAVSGQPETWLNLARARARLGQMDAAGNARSEYEMAMQRRPNQSPTVGLTPGVEWVEPEMFAKHASGNVAPLQQASRGTRPVSGLRLR